MNYSITINPGTQEEIEADVKVLLLEIFRKVKTDKTAQVITMRPATQRRLNDGDLHG